jgi:hypothetical protein
MISNADLSNVNYSIQRIEGEQTPQEDQPDKPPAPTNLSLTGTIGKITARATVANLIEGDLVEFYASTTNDRTLATREAFGAFTEFVHSLATGSVRYYWVRVRRPKEGVDSFSDWLPSSPTGGLSQTAANVGTVDLSDGSVTTPKIDDDAATEVYISTDASQTTSAIAESFVTISAPAVSVAHKALLTLVADVWKTAGTFAECYLARLSGGVPSGTVSQPVTITSTASPGQRIALQFEYDAAASTAVDYAFWYSASAPGNFGEARNIAFHVELIKR